MSASRSVVIVALVLVAATCGRRETRACPAAPLLRADQEGRAARLTWTGALDAGESWVLYRGVLADLRSTGVDASAPIHAGPETEWTDGDEGDWYYRVRCEGGATPGAWSNMGFRIVRTLPTWNWRQAGFGLSLPLLPGFPDVGDGADGWPCDDPADGVFTSSDVACAAWTDRDLVTDGRFTVEWLDTSRCSYRALTAGRAGAGPPHVLGSRTALEREDLREGGFITSASGDLMTNEVVIVGAHDPAFDGWSFGTHDGTCRLEVISVPYHARARTQTDLLCGLEGIDWTRDPLTGSPDRCDNGIYDPVSGGMVSIISVDDLLYEDLDGEVLGASVYWDELFGSLAFSGRHREIVPGDAYLVVLHSGYPDRTYLPPTY
jgi:hypothetical protein